MTDQETRAILTICLMAAAADGRTDDREGEAVDRALASLARDSGVDLQAIHDDVRLGRVSVEQAAAAIGSPDLRRLTWETAVGVCDADEARSAAESELLDRLRRGLGLEQSAVEPFQSQADSLAAEPVVDLAPAPSAGTAELDRMILNYSILNGALELLPQTLATLAIIPLQMKMVYRVGKAHGFELDRGHIKDFLTAAGVGMTGQYVEQFGRRLIGGLLGKVLGGAGRAVGSQATGSAFSFATTWAIGKVAVQYYGGGRKLDTDALRQAFAGLFEQAKAMQERYAPEIAQRARTLDLKRLTDELRR